MADEFQSTRPVRGATVLVWLCLLLVRISIHAPRAGRDNSIRLRPASPPRFQSTRPVRGATLPEHDLAALVPISIHAPRAGRDHAAPVGHNRPGISIHAPRAGRDICLPCALNLSAYFNPRAPCGARLKDNLLAETAELFQSTRPVRGAT